MPRSPRNPNRSRNLTTSKDLAPRDGCRDDPDAGDRFRREIDRGDGSGEAAVGQPTELRCGKGMRGAGETSDVDKETNRDFPGREIGGLSERARTASCKHSSVRGPNRSHVVGAAPRG